MTKNIAVAVIVGTAAAGPLGGGLNGLANDSKFITFMSDNNKSYHSVGELHRRAQIFNNNQAIVDGLNAESAATGKSNAATYEMNQFADMEDSEFQKNMTGLGHLEGGLTELKYVRGGNRVGNRAGVVDAVTVDHFADGNMYKVKNQGGCGSCWAFAANSALEGYIAKTRGTAPVRLSEQHLVDCTLRGSSHNKSLFGDDYERKYGLWGCGGGWMATAWRFQKDHGVMLDSDYPYTSGNTGKETQCAHKPNKTVGKVRNYGRISQSDGIEGMKEKLKTHPMTIAVDAGGGTFQFYKEGVVAANAGCGTNINHAVVLVGYTEKGDGGDDDDRPDPEPVDEECTVFKWWHTCKAKSNHRMLQDRNGFDNYWKIQNSWSDRWGDKGFILFEIAEGKGVCGMNQYVEWVEM